MVWAGAGVGAMYSMVSGAKLKYTKLMGFCETAMDDGEGMGPVGCGEEGKRKKKQKKKRKQKKDEETFFWFSSSFLFRLWL